MIKDKQIIEKQNEFKFGDIIINHHASENNPHRTGIFVNYDRRNTIVLTDMKGNFWFPLLDNDTILENIGSIIKLKALESLPEDELYRRVYIKSEKDLPEDDNPYYVHLIDPTDLLVKKSMTFFKTDIQKWMCEIEKF